ncbi:hypothetical protein ACYATO_08750 [Lactobacillaceae bacterium Melli_B3]
MKSNTKQHEQQVFTLIWKLALTLASFLSVIYAANLIIQIHLATVFIVPVFIDLIYFSSIYCNFDTYDEYQNQYVLKFDHKITTEETIILKYYYHKLSNMGKATTYSWIALLIGCIIWLFIESLIIIHHPWTNILLGGFYMIIACLIIENYVFTQAASSYKLENHKNKKR